ncbi:MAG: adenylate/guanylate cyclase domain-containing protein [bacterium]
MSRWWARRRLRAKIFLPFALLTLAVLLATLGLINAAVNGWVERSLATQFAVTGRVFNALLAERAQRLVTLTGLLARDFAFKRAVATYDTDTLVSMAANRRYREVDLLWITDASGKLLADFAGKVQAGRDVSALAPLAAGLAADDPIPGSAVTAVDGRLLELVAAPVLGPDDEPIGWLLAGEAIDDATAEQLRGATGPSVSFATVSTLYATSLTSGARRALFPGDRPGAGPLSELLHDPVPRPEHRAATLVNLRGGRALVNVSPIEAALAEPLFAVLESSYERALGPLRHLPGRVAAIGAVALAGGLLVGALIAGGIAAPLQVMVGAMRRVLAGDFTQRLTLRRGDEIGFLAGAFNEMVDGLAERERIKDTFGRFVSHEVAAAVLSGRLPLAGERREVTILFQDVRGFTSIAERTEPAALVSLVNRLFTEMVGAVEAQGGIIRVFTGDGVMALFGAPVGHPDDPERAVRAALDMVARLPALNRQIEAEGLEMLRIGIGIHTGDVVAGRIGPDQRSEYSVVGDAPNLASRIEGLTKEMRTPILISAVTAARLGPSFQLGRRAVLQVKGKEYPVEVVEVLGETVVV